jgi:hypothetical protein
MADGVYSAEELLMRTIKMTAKKSGTCTSCRQAIKPGQTIYWSKGAGASHVYCETQNDNSGIEDRACGDMAYEDACQRATEY